LNPGFFEPTFVMSIPVPHMATFANGIAPITKQARIFRRYVGSNSMMGGWVGVYGKTGSLPDSLPVTEIIR
jgi:hypothetical protein